MEKQDKDGDGRIIARIRENKSNNHQKMITIPKQSRLKVGDYVEVKKI